MARKLTEMDSAVSATYSKFAGLRRFSLIMGFLHLIQGVFMIVVSNATTYPIFTNYLSFDVVTRSLKPNTQLLHNLRFGPAVACFLLISAEAHLYLATVGYRRYVQNLKMVISLAHRDCSGLNTIRPTPR